MRKLNLKNIVIITALTFSLTACANQNVQKEKDLPETQPVEQYSTYEEQQEQPATNLENKSEEQEFSYFKEAKQEITNYVESEEYEQIKEKGKNYIITGIDFIFYDQPINGVYFNDLTEELKKDVIRDIQSLDEAIMAYYPDYKEDFQQKYQVASTFISEKYLEILDKIKEYLGEENYNAIGEKKDQVKEEIVEQKDNALEYIKNKYQEWKND